jgi:CHAT domain-containing protein
MALSSLPQSEVEVKKVAALFGKDTTVFLGGKATKQRFVAEAPQHRVLLLSTHGVLDEDYPMMSGLVFAPQSGKEPQLLQTFEIFDLALNSDFVVLSACEIGLGPLREGEGLLGIGRAFFYAGAGSLALTLWSVEDQASSELVTGLFSSRERGGRDDAAALRESKLAFIGARRTVESDQLATSHPFFWAPFVVVEGPRRRR